MFQHKKFYICALVGLLIKWFYEMQGATMKIAPTCVGATTPEQCDIHTSTRTLPIYAATSPPIVITH